jgi:RNA polymerase sigma-70 factor (ECF subfamily)
MMSEKDISRGCKRGIASAQQELFDRYSPYLMAVIYRYVADDDDAQDVLQDTFVSAYTNIQRFKWVGKGSLKAWLTRIAVNKSIDMLRTRKMLLKTTNPIDDISDPPDDDDNELSQDIGGLGIETIMKMISELPDGYRTVFNLYCLDGFSHQEIAEQLGISVNTSTSQLARAKAILAQKIRAHVNKQNNI